MGLKQCGPESYAYCSLAMAKVVNRVSLIRVLKEILDSDLTFHKVRTTLWDKLVKVQKDEVKMGHTFAITYSDWTTLKDFLCARNEKTGSEAALAFEKTLIRMLEDAEEVEIDASDAGSEAPKREQKSD